MISAWENGRQVPDAMYQRLLQQVFDLPAAALGFATDDPREADQSLAPLVRRGAERIEVSDSILGYFRRQFAEHVQLDNEAGPGLVLDVVGTQVQQVRRLADRGRSRPWNWRRTSPSTPGGCTRTPATCRGR
jgi:transcriptional regulator with XRE-family HTH domain